MNSDYDTSITHTVAHETQHRNTDVYQSNDPTMVGPNKGIAIAVHKAAIPPVVLNESIPGVVVAEEHLVA